MRHGVVDLDGPVHFLDFGGEGDPLLLVHGLGGSALNWMAVGPRLAERHRTLGARRCSSIPPSPACGFDLPIPP